MRVADDIAGLLAAGERAAFHGRPASGVEPLRRAVEIATDDGLDAEAAAAGWLLGVCLASAGRYGGALDVLDPLVAGDRSAESRLLSALASATVASVHRQLGRHTVAQGYDERALEGSEGAGEAGFDALLGLAADAVGLGDRATASARLAEASALVQGRVELVAPAGAAGLGRGGDRAARGARRGGGGGRGGRGRPRRALRRAAARRQGPALPRRGPSGGRPTGEAAGVLRRAGLLAESLGTLPLQWPVRAVLGALLAADAPEESARALDSARRAATAIADDLPEPLRAEWLGRPDVEALLEA